jgi:hypothetical protein
VRPETATKHEERELKLAVYIGWDPREVSAYEVCEHSLRTRSSIDVDIRPIVLDDLRKEKLYTRTTETRDGRLWDTISGAPMSTEFAISRFFVPLIAKRDNVDADWAIFCDCDFLWLGDIAELAAELDDEKALCCVQHNYTPTESVKMDGQAQLLYARKNWSSLMAFNLKHPKNERLDVGLLNSVPGRDLHRFCWLEDRELGSLSPDFNWLEGTYPVTPKPPRAVHFTRGGPWMSGWENVDYAELWLRELEATERSGSFVSEIRHS